MGIIFPPTLGETVWERCVPSDVNKWSNRTEELSSLFPRISATIWCPWPGLHSGGICGEMKKRTILQGAGFGPRWANKENKISDRRLNPKCVNGVRTSKNSGSTGPRRFGRAWSDGPDAGGPRRFTNTAVPRFDGTGCWQQHILVFRAIMKSNGWSTITAALQLFAHLDGEALHIALLMPDKIRERWKDLVTSLSEYYNTPGRLEVVCRQFENACRRPGLDPATFATELGILAVRGFSDMNEKARDLMICNKFIAAQRSCELRWHLDGAAEEASIRNIVDSCQIWESHAETVFVGSVRQDPHGSQSMSQVTVSDKSLPATSGSTGRWAHNTNNERTASESDS